MDQSGSKESLVLSYLGLRKAVGIIGIALPFLLAFGKLVWEGPGLQSSISGYYYTGMRNVFVGSVCAIAVFLMTYRGHDKDYVAGVLACVFALGVALFPVAPEVNATRCDRIVGALHLLFAACFFLTLSFFALVLFRKTDPTRKPTRRKAQRNAVYTVCGSTMLACLALIVVVKWMSIDSAVKGLAPVFWLESVAIVAFGVCWLTKGEAILGDPRGS